MMGCLKAQVGFCAKHNVLHFFFTDLLKVKTCKLGSWDACHTPACSRSFYVIPVFRLCNYLGCNYPCLMQDHNAIRCLPRLPVCCAGAVGGIWVRLRLLSSWYSSCQNGTCHVDSGREAGLKGLCHGFPSLSSQLSMRSTSNRISFPHQDHLVCKVY